VVKPTTEEGKVWVKHPQYGKPVYRKKRNIYADKYAPQWLYLVDKRN